MLVFDYDENVVTITAYFSIDPNRALDVILDCFEGRLVDQPNSQHSGLLQVMGMFDRTSLVQVRDPCGKLMIAYFGHDSGHNSIFGHDSILSW